jgi:hypothetical protein
LRLVAQGCEIGLGLGDDCIVVLGVAEFDQFDGLLDFALDAPIALNRALQLVALAQDLLGGRGVVPELGVFRLGVQLGEAPVCDVPVKDASSAAPTTS